MQRLKRFVHNAGILGTAQTLAVCVLLCIVMWADAMTGRWIVTVPILLTALVAAYAIRDFLVENFIRVRRVMNVLVVVGIGAYFLSRGQPVPQSFWLSAALFGCFGLYIGCYFWLLSDPRLARIR